MIFISTAGIKEKTLEQAVLRLAESGFTHIELSGAKETGQFWIEELLELQKKHRLTYNCHNYFFPRAADYALNLASLDDRIALYSLQYYREALRLCRRFGAERYAIHAGFYIDIPVDRLSKRIEPVPLSDPTVCRQRFYRGVRELQTDARARGLELYIENNVLSRANREAFSPHLPFMLLQASDYHELNVQTNTPLLLDIAHLKVSAVSLGLDLNKQIKELLPHTTYIHLSDNDGVNDQNLGLSHSSTLLNTLSNHRLRDKTITLEIAGDMDTLNQSYALAKELIS